MKNKLVYWSGILGVFLFVFTAILGGFQFENYNFVSQYISETTAVDTPYGKELRYFGVIPSGILLSIFSFGVIGLFPKSKIVKIGFIGLGIFYGLATIIVGLFPCDKGCNMQITNPSISQIIHTFTGLLTYLFVPISIILIGIGLYKVKNHRLLSKIAITCGMVSMVFVVILISNTFSDYVGLFQRIVETLFIIWIIISAFFIKKHSKND